MNSEPSNRPTLTASILVFLLLSANYAFFYQGNGYNQMSRYALTACLAQQGSVEISEYHHLTLDKSLKDGRFFSDKPPGLSLLGVPIFLMLEWIAQPLHLSAADWRNFSLYILTLFTVSLPVALAMSSFFRRASMEAGARAAFWITLALALGSPLTVYASLYYSHALAAALMWFSFALVTRPKSEGETISLPRYALAGLLAGWATLSEMPTALITISLAGYVLLSTRWSLKPTLAFVGGGLPTLGILLGYNWLAFGHPLANGYQYCFLPEFQAAMSQGLMGVTGPSWEAFQGIVFGTRCGLLFYWPFFFFCVIPCAGLLVIRRTNHGPTLLALVVLGVYLLFGCSYYMWTGGAAFGPRHLIPCLPFAAYLVVRGAAFLPGAFLVISSLASMLVVLVSVSTLAECPESFRFPLLNVAVPLFLMGRLSVKIVLDDGRFAIPATDPAPDDPHYYDAVNLGEMVGITGTLSVLPLVVATGILGALIWRLTVRHPIDAPPSATSP